MSEHILEEPIYTEAFFVSTLPMRITLEVYQPKLGVLAKWKSHQV